MWVILLSERDGAVDSENKVENYQLDYFSRRIESVNAARETRVARQREMQKGDFPGHPFRGNQYVGGIYANPSGANPKDRRKTGLASQAKKLQSGKKVTVPNPKAANDLIDYLHEMSKRSAKEGKKAKGFDLCKVTVPGTNLFCGSNKGVRRIGMPQLGGHEDKFVSSLRAKGIKVKEETRKASELKATQNELVGTKVAGMMNNKKFDPKERAILVSKDGYIVDGHHRWATQIGRDTSDGRLGDLSMKVIVIDKPIMKVIKDANDFADSLGLKRKSGEDTGADSELKKFYYSKPRPNIKKAQPTPSDVHVDAIFTIPKKKKKKKVVEMAITKRSGGLSTWFREDWVDISRPKKGGGFEPCGRSDASSGKYPKCVPASKAAKMTPEQRRSAISRKRKAESSQKREGKKPINVSTFTKGDFAGHPFRGNQHTGGIPDSSVGISLGIGGSAPARQRMGLSNKKLKKDKNGRYVKNKEWQEWTSNRRGTKENPNSKEFVKEVKNWAGKSVSWVRSTRGNTTLGTQEKLARKQIRDSVYDEWGVTLPNKTLDDLYREAEGAYLKGNKRSVSKPPKKQIELDPKPDTRTSSEKRKDTLRSKMTRKERRESFKREQSRIKAQTIKEGLKQWHKDNAKGKQVVSATMRGDEKEKLPEPIKISSRNKRGTRDLDLGSQRLRLVGAKRRKIARSIERSAVADGKAVFWRDPSNNKVIFRWIEPTDTEPLKSRGAEQRPKKGYRWGSDTKGKPYAGRSPYTLKYNDERQGWEWTKFEKPKGTGKLPKVKTIKIKGGQRIKEFESPKQALTLRPKTVPTDKRTKGYREYRKRQEQGQATAYGYKSMKGYRAARKKFNEHRDYYIENPDKWAVQRKKFLSKSIKEKTEKG